ncbi:MAG: prepilin-type N-terminal cleavage/methylation domain-containing protein [Thermoproteota archaeon]
MAKNGFTFIEIMIAVAIIIVLIFVVTIGWSSISSRYNKAIVANSIFNGIYLFYVNNKHLPTDLNSFVRGTSPESKGYIGSFPFTVSASAVANSFGYDITIIVDGTSYNYSLKSGDVP